MRTLVVGAGATGGYFGGRLLEAGRDVTFLVRPRRAQELAQDGLRIKSPYGDIAFDVPPAVSAQNLAEHFHLILLSCKAYDLASAMAAFAPAVGPKTAILPLLNGMRHLEILSSRFGPERVLGGQCMIAATLNEKREIIHMNDAHSISFGELDGTRSDRIQAIETVLSGAKFEVRASPEILQVMWEKWVILATLAGSTCLMRASIGDIAKAAGGTDFMLRLLDECRSIAIAEGYTPSKEFLERTRGRLADKDSPLTASMFRDIQNGAPVEADHVIGDLLERAGRHGLLLGGASLLPIVYTHLKAYEARRKDGVRDI